MILKRALVGAIATLTLFAIVFPLFFLPEQGGKLEQKKRVVLPERKKAKLAIIIDDVASLEELQALLNTNIVFTPAFFPPTKKTPDTPKLAKLVGEYLVHLPLEALSYPHEQEMTLRVGESFEIIEKEIGKIRRDFKNLKALNSHTGSAFTQDRVSMSNLLQVLKKNHLLFLDSKTTHKSVAVEVGNTLGMKILQRDIFLDNNNNMTYIKNQLKKAVTLAKKEGFAVAIGHPKSNTIRVLQASQEILQEVELVYITKYM